jgi:hypothetical protein
MRHLIPSISRLKAHYYKHSPSKSPGLRGIRQLVHGLTATALTPVLFPAPLIVQQAKSPSLPVPFASSNSKGSIIAAAHRPRCRVAWRRSLTGGGVHARGGVDAGGPTSSPVVHLRGEKEAAERATVALCAELEKERGGGVQSCLHAGHLRFCRLHTCYAHIVVMTQLKLASTPVMHNSCHH